MAENAPFSPQGISTMRRSVTLPIRPSNEHRRDSSPDPQIETLFAHPSARVISFNATAPSNNRRDSVTGEDEPGSLSWTSNLERTIAVGPLQLYRTPNGVVFLNCGSVVKPIFKKSKCWCVEEASGKFVLEMRKPTYWRLEVPNKNAEEIERMERLKDVFSEILLFEKTACPFQRNFTVELPPEAGMPIRYRPWKAREGPKKAIEEEALVEQPVEQSSKPPTIPSFELPLEQPLEDASKQPSEEPTEAVPVPPLLAPLVQPLVQALEVNQDQPLEQTLESPSVSSPDQSLERPSVQPQEQLLEEPDILSQVARKSEPSELPISADTQSADDHVNASSDEGLSLDGQEHDSDATEDSVVTPPASLPGSTLPLKLPSEGLLASRSVTAPPQLTLVTSPPSKSQRAKSPRGPTTPLGRTDSNASNSSDKSSADSFHSVQSWHSPITPLPPSPPQSNPASPTTFPYPHDNIILPKRPHHTREISEMTITPDSAQWQPMDSTTPQPNSRTNSPKPSALTGSKPDLIVDAISTNLNEEHFEIAPPTVTKPSQLRPRSNVPSDSRRRALSPLPPAANIFSPTRQRPRRLQTGRHIPTQILQKTYEILVSPPSHLVHLMLAWAARIARDGFWASFSEEGSSGDDSWGYNEGEWGLEGINATDVDDYGMPIEVVPSRDKKPKNQTSVRRRVGRERERERERETETETGVGGSWEVD